MILFALILCAFLQMRKVYIVLYAFFVVIATRPTERKTKYLHLNGIKVIFVNLALYIFNQTHPSFTNTFHFEIIVYVYRSKI